MSDSVKPLPRPVYPVNRTRAWLATLTLSLASLTAPGLHAVILATGDGTQNTTGTGAGLGWDYVGTVSFGSGVYLGNYGGDNWVLTAWHVGEGSFTLGGTTYGAVANSSVRVQNADTSPTDLCLFKINGNPGLAAIPISATSPTLGTYAKMIGAGRDRDTTLTEWSVTGTSPDYTWSEVPSGGNAGGYKWAPTRAMRWGENTLDAALSFNAGYGNVEGLATDFDYSVQQAQGASGDSGGGVFTYNLSTSMWELTGLMLAIGSYDNQPGGTAVFGNVTYLADLSSYRDNIFTTLPLPTVIPEPASYTALAGVGVLLLALKRRKRA
ncbi:MAG: hypothetical protein RIQ79_2271 [Verrucomicrobiota bacterium]